MDYEITIGDTRKKLSISDLRNGQEYEVKAEDGTVLAVSVLSEEQSGRYVISIGQRVYSLKEQRRTPTSIQFIMDGEQISAALAQKKGQQQGVSVSSNVASVNELVTSNFPAKVIKVSFSKKDSKIMKGETLIVLEAMKMEAQIKAPRDCLLLDIFVNEGDVIAKGAKLARLKFV